MDKKPNVLIIFTDQQRYDTLKAAGYDHMITPNLDKLASEGCLYTCGHTHNPVCMPARHDLLTGLTGKYHGYFSNAGKKPIADYGLPTLPRIFQEKGYRTASIGKMHFHPARAHHGYGEMYTMEEIPTHRADDDYALFLEKEGLREVQNLHGVRPLGYHAAQKAQTDLAHYETTWLENTTKTWLEENGEAPFLLFLSYIKPHPPWNIPEEYANCYKDVEFPPVVPRSRHYPNNNEDNPWYGDGDSDTLLRKNREAYYTACTMVDESIGKVLAHLDSMGKTDETLIIFTSDHGEMMGDKGYYSKNLPYESSIRVPMIVRYPEKVKPGTQKDDFVDLLDVLPTCLDVCGLDYPENAPKLYGSSLLDQETTKNREVLFASNGFLKPDRWVMARSRQYKYVYNYNQGYQEFYDLTADPGEITNLADSLFQQDLICGGHWKGKPEHHLDSFIGDQGKAWLSQQIASKKGESDPKPWFFALSFPGPHQPYDGAGTGFESRYLLADMNRNETTFQDLEGKPPHFKALNRRRYLSGYPEETFRETLRSYYANISHIDQKVGEIVALLKETGIFTWENGLNWRTQGRN